MALITIGQWSRLSGCVAFLTFGLLWVSAARADGLRSISINFNKDKGSVSGTFGIEPSSAWNNVSGSSGTAVVVKDSEGNSAKLSWTCPNLYQWSSRLDELEEWQKGYLDDSTTTGPTITLEDIPYANYDVIVYQANGGTGAYFNPPCVNGIWYSYDGASRAWAAANASIKYGLSDPHTAEVGVNVIRLKKDLNFVHHSIHFCETHNTCNNV